MAVRIGESKTALSLVLLAVLLAVGYRWWASRDVELAATDVGAFQEATERDRVGPLPLAEPEHDSSGEPASAPDDASVRSAAPVEAAIGASGEALTGSLHVNVVFADGTPAQGIGVSVALRHTSSSASDAASNGKSLGAQRRRSDEHGRVVFSQLGPGEYMLTTDRYPMDVRSVEIAPGETEVVALSLAGQDLEVMVVDERDAPIEDAAVLLGVWLMPPVEIGRTDALGKLAIRAAPLPCNVGATKIGYLPSPSYDVMNSPPTALRIALGAPGGVLEGRVIGPDGTEVFDALDARVDVIARVEEEDRFIDTDGFLDRDGLVTRPVSVWESVANSTGFFRLDLPPGDVSVSVNSRDLGHASWTGSCVVVRGAVTRLDVRLERAARCTGIVRTSSGEPSSGTTVDALSGGLCVGSITTDELGAFLLGHIPAGELVLSARSADGSSARAVLFVQGGETVQQDLELADVRVFRGRVVDAQGKGLRGLTVTAMSGSGARSTITDGTGAFAITEVPEQGAVQLIVQKNGADVARRELQLPIEEPLVVQIDDIALGSIRGRIVDATGAAIGHAWIMHTFVGGSPPPYTPTDLSEKESGVFELRNMVEGSYVVVVEAQGFESFSTDVHVRRDETTELGDLVMTRRR